MVYRVLAQGMELPDETFVRLHNFDGPADTSGTFSPLSQCDAPVDDTLHSPRDEIVRYENRMIFAHHSLVMLGSYPRSAEEETQTNNVWMKGHTGSSHCAPAVIFRFTNFLIDIGTITILWSQPVAGLQILCPDGKWRWVRHIDNALVRSIALSL